MSKIENYKIIDYDNIKPNYYIYDDGRVYSMISNRFLKGNIDAYGYLRYHLQRKDGTEKMYKAHRLVKIMFDPIFNMEQLTVDHLNCNKLDNRLQNLEWCSDRENVKRAIKNKLIHKSNRILTDNEIIEICEFLSKGYAPRMIAQFLYPESIEQYQNIIQNIRERKYWTEFSNNYNFFYKYPNFNSKKWTIWQIEEVCQMIQDTNKTDKEISNKVFKSNKKEDIKMIHLIRTHNKYKIVSQYYKF